MYFTIEPKIVCQLTDVKTLNTAKNKKSEN